MRGPWSPVILAMGILGLAFSSQFADASRVLVFNNEAATKIAASSSSFAQVVGTMGRELLQVGDAARQIYGTPYRPTYNPRASTTRTTTAAPRQAPRPLPRPMVYPRPAGGVAYATPQAIIRPDRASIAGDMYVGDSSSGSQAAYYARGASMATGSAAYALSVEGLDESGGAHAAADAIRRQAGYQGSSIAGDIFTGDNYGASPAEDAIRRTMADSAAIQARTQGMYARYDSATPWDF